MKRRPDMLMVLAAAFAIGVLVTVLVPVSSETVAAPASPLQAGIVELR